MGKVLSVDSEPADISFKKILISRSILGAVLGLVFFLVSIAIDNIWHLGPTSGNIAIVLVAGLSLAALVVYRSAQPLFMSILPAIMVWGLFSLINNLSWFNGLAWSVLIYFLAYSLITWLTYQLKLTYNLVIAIIIIILFRIVLNS